MWNSLWIVVNSSSDFHSKSKDFSNFSSSTDSVSSQIKIWLVVSTPLKNMSQLGWWKFIKFHGSKPPTSHRWIPVFPHLWWWTINPPRNNLVMTNSLQTGKSPFLIDKSLNKMSVSENGVYSPVMAISDWENDDWLWICLRFPYILRNLFKHNHRISIIYGFYHYP